MKKVITPILFLVFMSSLSFPQERVRGVSKPGRLGEKKIKILSPSQTSEIICSLSFQEPSGDNIINEGEDASVSVDVKNSTNQMITPKLEISVQSSWAPKPRSSTKWMKSIKSGETGKYISTIKWDERLPSGIITYKVKAVDVNLGLESKPVDLSFNIVGKGDRAEVPIFVDVDKTIPKVLVDNSDAIAVVIGNKNYSNPDVPDVDYAINDASIIRNYLMNMLGFLESNIIYLDNAKKADFELVFGTRDVHEGRLYNFVKPNQSDVFIYYSGHGAPDTRDKKGYFMPSNCDPNYIKIGGYPLDIFYANLEKIPAKSITVVVDACFSGASQQGMLVKKASPMYIDVKTPLFGDKFNLFTSAAGDQIASWYPEGNHSLFTYYFLRALRGEADKNRNRQITLEEINDFLQENVPYMARRLYGREQTPVVKGRSHAVISTY